MFRKDRSVLVMLTPSRMQATLLRGKAVVATVAAELAPGTWADAWEQGLYQFDEPLQGLLKQLRATGCVVNVLYHGKEASVDVQTLQMQAPDAVAAAELALHAESGGARLGLCVPVWSNRTPPFRTQVLVVSDRNETVASIAACVRRAGGVPGRTLPLSAVKLAQVGADISADTSDTPICQIVMGHDTTVLGGGSSGEVAFLRSVDLGVTQLAEALVQASIEGGVKFTQASAREYLQHHGLPDKSDEANGAVRMERAMPLLYPVLQRMVVEIRQTLRFGFGQNQGRAQVLLSGVGGAIPGLADALSLQLECDVLAMPHTEMVDPVLATELLRTRGFVAEYERGEQQARALTQALGLGLLLAAGVLGGEFLWLHGQRDAVRSRLEARAPEVAAAAQEMQVRREAATLAVELRKLNEAITGAERERVDIYAVMSEVTRVTPANVRIDEMSVSVQDDYTILGMRGAAMWTDKAELDPLTNFLSGLRECPLVDGVELGSTRVQDGANGKCKEFTLNARLKRVNLTASGEKP